MKPRVSIVMVNWNGGPQLQMAVDSIGTTSQETWELQRLVIIDNASTDQSLQGMDAREKPPTVIRNPLNLGFGRACNQGAALTEGEYLLFLNPDTRLYDNSISLAIDYIEEPGNADVGVVGIQLIDDEKQIARSCARFPTFGLFIAQSLGLNRLPGLNSLNVHYLPEWSPGRTKNVDHVIGAFYLIRRSLFEMLGGFDERFFVYLEDLDLSLRVHQAGWRSVYLAQVQAFHAGGGNSRQVLARRLFYSLRSRILYGFKHFKHWQAWTLLAVTLVLELVTRSLFSLARGGVRELRNTVRGYAMLYADLPSILSLRGVRR